MTAHFPALTHQQKDTQTRIRCSEALKSSLRKFYGRHHKLVDRFEISILHMTMNTLLCT